MFSVIKQTDNQEGGFVYFMSASISSVNGGSGGGDWTPIAGFPASTRSYADLMPITTGYWTLDLVKASVQQYIVPFLQSTIGYGQYKEYMIMQYMIGSTSSPIKDYYLPWAFPTSLLDMFLHNLQTSDSTLIATGTGATYLYLRVPVGAYNNGANSGTLFYLYYSNRGDGTYSLSINYDAFRPDATTSFIWYAR